MAANSRFLFMGLGFLALVGLFLFIQRQPSNDVPVAEDVLQETSPRIDVFDAKVTEPTLIRPTGAGANIPATDSQAKPVPLQPGSGLAVDYGVTTAEPAIVPTAGLNPPRAVTTPSTAGPGASGPGSAAAQGGPAASLDPSMPITEMISLPPDGPGPDAGSVDMSGFAPEQGSIDSAMAPEAGSSGVMGDAPELLPVTHPGPAGEMPDNTGPLPPQ